MLAAVEDFFSLLADPPEKCDIVTARAGDVKVNVGVLEAAHANSKLFLFNYER